MILQRCSGPHGDWKQEVEELDKVGVLFYYEWEYYFIISGTI